jgi:hypothetical protein
VKAGRDEETGAERHYIGPIVISLKRDLAASMEKLLLKAVFRIHVFFGLPNPNPLVRSMDPDPALDPDPSIIMQK